MVRQFQNVVPIKGITQYWAWRDGSLIKSSGYSLIGPGFKSKNRLGDSQVHRPHAIKIIPTHKIKNKNLNILENILI